MLEVMQKILHITEKKRLTEALQRTTFCSEVIAWNEMLCEGKTSVDIGSEHFWKNRYDFFKNEYKTTKSSFVETVLKEYKNLCNQKKQDEIVLWFGEDLQSQINMVGVISWLNKHRKNVQLSWIHKKDEFLTSQELETCFLNRTFLNQDDIEYADYVWQLYCSDSPLQLQNHITNIDTRLIAISPALKIHLKRFPSVKNGLNYPENNVLKAAWQFEGAKSDFLDYLTTNQKNLGYTPHQYEKILHDLKMLFISLNPLKINAEGEKVLRNESNMYAMLRNENTFFGGSLKYNFLYNEISGKIHKL